MSDMNYDDVVPISVTHLDVVERRLAVEFSRLQLQQGKINVVEDFLTKHLRYTASWKVAAQKAQDTVRAPRDWWEAFKERWLPSWALRRWPIQYTEWRAYRILPAIDLPAPRMEGSYFEFVREWTGDP